MLEYREDQTTGVVEITISGWVSREEFDSVADKLEALIALHGQIRVLEIIHDFEGMDAGAFWDDLKFSLRHLSDISRCAVISDEQYVNLLSELLSPFLRCKVAHFEPHEIDKAHAWLEKIA